MDWIGNAPLTREEQEAWDMLQAKLEDDTDAQERVRTLRQNAALYRWERAIAKKLNDAGFSLNDHRLLVKDIPWTQEWIHELLFHGYMGTMYPKKKSSKELTTVEMSRVHQAVEAAISSRTGVYEPFDLRG